MGFLFCRICHFYGYTPNQVSAMPIRQFWMMSKTIDRILAERDLETARIANHSQSQEGMKTLVTQLETRRGTVVKVSQLAVNRIDEERDEMGFKWLKMVGQHQRIGDTYTV